MEVTLNRLRAFCVGQGMQLEIERDGQMFLDGRPLNERSLAERIAASEGRPIPAPQAAPSGAPSAVTLQPRQDAIYLQADGYETLALVLQRAFIQAAHGKGKERHANGEPFTHQVMQDGARRFGVGALLFQAFKKSEESQRLPLDRGVNELLGAIVYLAGAVIARERAEAVPPAANDNPPTASANRA